MRIAYLRRTDRQTERKVHLLSCASQLKIYSVCCSFSSFQIPISTFLFQSSGVFLVFTYFGCLYYDLLLLPRIVNLLFTWINPLMESSVYSISSWKLSKTFFKSKNRWRPVCRCFSSSFILASHSCNHIYLRIIFFMPQTILLAKHFEIIQSANSFLIVQHQLQLNIPLNTSFQWVTEPWQPEVLWTHQIVVFSSNIFPTIFYDREIFVDK